MGNKARAKNVAMRQALQQLQNHPILDWAESILHMVLDQCTKYFIIPHDGAHCIAAIALFDMNDL